MNHATNLEHRASSSRSKHEGEPSLGLCDRLDRTRDNSQRQLPTDHDYAVPTREYQTDQSSLKSAQAAARPVLGKRQRQRQKQTHIFAALTRSLHIRAMRSSRYGRPEHIAGFDTWRFIALRELGFRFLRSNDENVWSAARLQGGSLVEKTSLRKWIRPLVGD
jgi:hypothetical protein